MRRIVTSPGATGVALLLGCLALGVGPARGVAAEPASPSQNGTPPAGNGTGTGTPSREELQKLTPAEREARLQQLRERRAAKLKELTPAEREHRRQLIQQRFQQRLDALKKKQKEGGLTAEEQGQLKRLEQVAENFKKARAAAPPPPPVPPAGTPEKRKAD
jgi:hypothetical protein